MRKNIALLVAAVVIVLATAGTAVTTPLSGAIFTTTPDGSIVNENVRYGSKLEVYLDGGPGPNAPKTAAGLDDGNYVFQVTDPSGKFLLSEDPSKCRVVTVDDGVIVGLVNPTATYTKNGRTYPCHIQDGPEGAAGSSGRHDTNTDIDHGPPAIVVQLMPYGTTPNPGGVYKAWMTPLATYVAKGGNPETAPQGVRGRDAQPCPDFCASADPGFKHPDVKTDNFKVKRPRVEAPVIFVQKFHDKNFNGVQDSGEESVTGWLISIFDPGIGLLVSPLFTPVTYIAANVGTYRVTEDLPGGALQTVSRLDGVTASLFPTADPVVDVVVSGLSGETHTVVYGNVGLGGIDACKIYDRDADGESDAGEPPIAGWRLRLTGTLANGASFVPIEQATNGGGCATFSDLLPGTYTVTEVIPATGGWEASGAITQNVVIASTLSGATMSGGTHTVTFTNFCEGTADFDTKGYWHNPNGIQEITAGDISFLNSLSPYDDATSYWELPFDGTWTPSGNTFFGGDTDIGEISDYLVNSVSADPHRFQLSQQLLAFILNVRHRLDGITAVELPDGTTAGVAGIISDAIDAWESGSDAERTAMIGLLDALNNSDAVPFVHNDPCPVIY